MARKKSFDYFDAFQRHAQCGKDAAKFLEETLVDYDNEQLVAKLDELHVIENKADDINHEVAQNLRIDFVTPLDREDISQLANNLDNIVDEIEDILMAFYMFHVNKVNHHMVAMGKQMIDATSNLYEALVVLPRFKKASDDIMPYLVATNEAEEECDRLYLEAMHELHDPANFTTALEVIALERVYNDIEDALDAIQNTASFIEEIIMTNL